MCCILAVNIASAASYVQSGNPESPCPIGPYAIGLVTASRSYKSSLRSFLLTPNTHPASEGQAGFFEGRAFRRNTTPWPLRFFLAHWVRHTPRDGVGLEIVEPRG